LSSAVIVQARMRSTRLLGKVLLPLSGRPVLDHVIRRCRRVAGADAVVYAMPAAADCDPLAEVAVVAGAVVVRGPEGRLCLQQRSADVATWARLRGYDGQGAVPS
jgi:spore coat polysaccharide biosynthesis protein SpsF (cytidylyltransferase family)